MIIDYDIHQILSFIIHGSSYEAPVLFWVQLQNKVRYILFFTLLDKGIVFLFHNFSKKIYYILTPLIFSCFLHESDWYVHDIPVAGVPNLKACCISLGKCFSTSCIATSAFFTQSANTLGNSFALLSCITSNPVKT